MAIYYLIPAKSKICEQASNTLQHINSAKISTKRSSMAGSGISLGACGQLTSKLYSSVTHGFTILRIGLSCNSVTQYIMTSVRGHSKHVNDFIYLPLYEIREWITSNFVRLSLAKRLLCSYWAQTIEQQQPFLQF